ncbi:MAG: hypothetical protein Q7S26_02125 [bacterium]|nr:hypothetical protein [bacterium]
MKTTVMFKTDKKLKEAAQKTAKQMGIPFSAVMNGYMQEFVNKREITFRTPFEKVEDAIWGERALKAEKEGYMGVQETKRFLEQLRKKHARN